MFTIHNNALETYNLIIIIKLMLEELSEFTLNQFGNGEIRYVLANIQNISGNAAQVHINGVGKL